jgi:hypothetical protein
MELDGDAVERGARNLLLGCAGARPGETLLIVEEDPSGGYYEAGLGEAVAAAAGRLGLTVRRIGIAFSPEADALTPALEREVRASDHQLFLARLGDQLRFRAMPEGSRPIVSYALDRAALGSGFGGAPHQVFVVLKKAFDQLFAQARHIRVTCPLGTSFEGAPPRIPDAPPADVTIKRFPMSVFAPLDAGGFTGRVRVAHLLVGTGSRYYQPYGLPVDGPLFAVIAGGRLVGWEGDAAEVARAERHYAHVAGLFGIDGGFVHSWHAGIHPGCAYIGRADDHYERWSGSAFGNPRLLHFHTCGAYAPGEICWNVVDPTIEVDGVTVYDAGRIRLEAVPGAMKALDSQPEARDLFERPSRQIGIGAAP